MFAVIRIHFVLRWCWIIFGQCWLNFYTKSIPNRSQMSTSMAIFHFIWCAIIFYIGLSAFFFLYSSWVCRTRTKANHSNVYCSGMVSCTKNISKSLFNLNIIQCSLCWTQLFSSFEPTGSVQVFGDTFDVASHQVHDIVVLNMRKSCMQSNKLSYSMHASWRGSLRFVVFVYFADLFPFSTLLMSFVYTYISSILLVDCKSFSVCVVCIKLSSCGRSLSLYLFAYALLFHCLLLFVYLMMRYVITIFAIACACSKILSWHETLTSVKTNTWLSFKWLFIPIWILIKSPFIVYMQRILCAMSI